MTTASEAVSYIPVFEGPIEGWVKNWMKKNFWKLEKHYQQSEVLQEARKMVHELWVNYYKDKVVEAKHFQSLFMRAFSNRMTDWANKSTKFSAEISMMHLSDEDHELLSTMTSDADVEAEVSLQQSIAAAPKEIRDVLQIAAEAPREIAEICIEALSGRGDTKKAALAALSKIVGYEVSWNIGDEVKSYLRFN